MPKTIKTLKNISPQDIKKGNYTVPGNIRSIGYQAFSGNINIINVNIQNGVQVISNLAFADCKKLRKIEIPPSVNSIAKLAFQGCSSINEIEVDEVNKFYNDMTLLHIAASSCSSAMIHTLLKKPNIHLLEKTKKSGENPLLIYVKNILKNNQYGDEQPAAITVFLEYRQAIIERIGQNNCDIEMQNIANQLNIRLDDLNRGKLFVDFTEELMQDLIEDEQSVHTDIAHKTAAATALNLQIQYRNVTFVRENFVNQVGKKLAENFLKVIDDHQNTKEELSGCNLKQILSWLWAGLNDNLFVKENQRSLEDNITGLKNAIITLLYPNGSKHPVCFGGLFNGMMQLAYTCGIPGAIVIMDETEKSQVSEILYERHSLMGHYQCLPPCTKELLFSNINAFIEWRNNLHAQEREIIKRYRPGTSLRYGIRPFLFVNEYLTTILDSYALNHEQFKIKTQQTSQICLLPSFAGIDTREGIHRLCVMFNNFMNFDSIYKSWETFKGVLQEAGIALPYQNVTSMDKKTLVNLASSFFDSQVKRMLSEAKLKNVTTKKMYHFSEHWAMLKEVQIANCLNQPWVQQCSTFTELASSSNRKRPQTSEPPRIRITRKRPRIS